MRETIPGPILDDCSLAVVTAVRQNSPEILRYLVGQRAPVDGNAIQAAVDIGSKECLQILFTQWDINRLLRPDATTALG